MSPDEAVHWLYVQHVISLPKHMQVPRSRWTVENMPRAYLNMKKKCYDDTGLICKKAHAHVREIIASPGFPLKRQLQTMSRAFQTLIENSRQTHWELWSMRGATPTLQKYTRTWCKEECRWTRACNVAMTKSAHAQSRQTYHSCSKMWNQVV